MLRYFLIAFIFLLLTGCTKNINPQFDTSNTKNLYKLLIKSQTDINHNEARRLSKVSISYSRTLAKKYGTNTTPLVHNLLVNVGIKKRGLCYQWSDDLQEKLKKQNFKTVLIATVGANIGKFTEHNALVILPNDRNMSQGVLLDPWRKSGELYFSHILHDPEYKWAIRYDRY